MGGHNAFVFIKLFLLFTSAYCSVIRQASVASAHTHTSTSTTLVTVLQNEEAASVFGKFSLVKSDSSSSSDSDSSGKVKKLIHEFKNVKVDYFLKIIEKEEYFQHFAKVVGYKGKHDAESLKKFLYEEGLKKRNMKKFALAMKHICENYESKKELPKQAKRKWNGYAIRNFANFNPTKGVSAFITARLKKLINIEAEETTYLAQILKKSEYAEFLAKATAFSGDYKDTEALTKHIEKTIETEPRIVGAAIQSITRNQVNSSSKLEISTLVKERYGIVTGSEKSYTKKEETKTKTTKKSEAITYAVTNFANKKSTELGDVKELETKLTELFNIKTSKEVTYLDQLLETKEYCKFLARGTGYREDYKKTEELKKHIKQTATKEPTLVASAVMKIIKKEENFSNKLRLSKFMKEKLKVIKKTTETESKEVTNKSSKQSETKQSEKKEVKSHESEKKHVSEVKESQKTEASHEESQIQETKSKKQEVKSEVEESQKSKVSQKESQTEETKSKKQEVKSQVAKSEVEESQKSKVSQKESQTEETKSKKQEVKSQVAKSEVEESQKSKVSQKESQTEETKSKKQEVKSQEVESGSSKVTASKYTNYLKQFKSITETRASSELKNICENFRTAENGAALQELLKNEAIYDFFVDITRYTGQQNKSAFCNFLVNEYFNKRPKFAALLLQKVYYYLESQSPLKAPEYCTNYWKSEEKTVTKSSSSSSSVSSSSSTTKTKNKSLEVLSSFKDCGSDSDEGTKQTYYQSLISLQKSKKDWLLKTLQNEVYFNYVKQCIGIQKDQKITAEQLYQIWTENFFKKESSQYTSIILKNIYNHMTNKKTTLEPTRYITSYQDHTSYKESVKVIQTSVTTSVTTTTSSTSSSVTTSSEVTE